MSATPTAAPAAPRLRARAVIGFVLFTLLVPAVLFVAGGYPGWLAGAALVARTALEDRLLLARLPGLRRTHALAPDARALVGPACGASRRRR